VRTAVASAPVADDSGIERVAGSQDGRQQKGKERSSHSRLFFAKKAKKTKPLRKNRIFLRGSGKIKRLAENKTLQEESHLPAGPSS
jgi:hypothetical protein